MKAAGGLNTSQSVHHFTSVSSSIIWLRILDSQRRLVIPEEQLVLATRINFPRIFEPSRQQYDVQLLKIRNGIQYHNVSNLIKIVKEGTTAI